MSPLESLIALEIDARAYGFDWPDHEMIIAQAESECEEIREALTLNEPKERLQEEIGDLIHTAVSLCLFAGFDPEETIAVIVKKFGKRMMRVKELAQKDGHPDLKGQSLDYMLSLWKKAKMD